MPQQADAARLSTFGAESTTTETTFFGGTFDTDIKRSGNGSYRFNVTDNVGILYAFATTTPYTSPLYSRMYFRAEDLPSEPVGIVSFVHGTESTYANLRVNADGTLTWEDGAGTTLGTTTEMLSADTWYRIEVRYDPGDDVQVRLDGVEVISETVSHGTDAAVVFMGVCAGGGVYDCGGGGSGVTTADFYFDDIAVNDSNGSNQTSWPGEGKVVHMQPDGGAGDNNDANSGSCADVDEVEFDDSTTAATLGDNNDILDCTVESSSSAGLSSTDSITLVQVGVRTAASGIFQTYSSTLRIKSASGGSVLESGTQSTLSANGAYFTNYTNVIAISVDYRLTSYVDPTTGVAWTPTGTNSLDNMQIGTQAIDADPDINVTALWAVVEYTEYVEPTRKVLRLGKVRLGGSAFVVENQWDVI